MNNPALMRTLAAGVLAAAAVIAGVPAGPAAADDCPDVELIFARGTGEPPGPGRVGQALADALVPQLGGRSLNVYGVDYPASLNFLNASSGADGAAAADDCPDVELIFARGTGEPPGVGREIGRAHV